MRLAPLRPLTRHMLSSRPLAAPVAIASSSSVRLDATSIPYPHRHYTTSRPLNASASSASPSSSTQPSPSTSSSTPPPPTPPPKRSSGPHVPKTTRAPSSPDEPNVYKDDTHPCVNLTDRAIAHLTKVAVKEGAAASEGRVGLRIAVEPGGCHGYQYKMEIERCEDSSGQVGDEDDFHFQADPAETTPNVQPLPLIIDSVSLTLLRGSTIDYVTELIGSQFAIKDNPQAKGAGCGCGVSWEPNV